MIIRRLGQYEIWKKEIIKESMWSPSKNHGLKLKQSHQSMAILPICIFCCCYNEALAENRLWSSHPGLNSVCSCTFKAVLLLLRRFIVSVHSGVSLCIHSMRVRILIFEITLITKKEGGKNCSSWPKAIKGTLISLAIMLWGILNSVISACYIWRKVSGNCFVLLEQKKKKLLKWAHVALSTTWLFASGPSAPSPQVLLLVPTPDSQRFSHKGWLVWRNPCHRGKNRLWHQPLDDFAATYKETVIICTKNRLVWVIGLWASSVAGCQAAPFDHFINSFVTIVSPWSYSWLHSKSSPCPSLLFCPCLLVSIHPSTHLAGVRRDRPSGARDGATAGAQSDKERQITLLTRTIHHRFISYPSLPPHLHLKFCAPGRQLQEKEKKISTLFPGVVLIQSLLMLLRQSACSSIKMRGNNEEKAQEKTAR